MKNVYKILMLNLLFAFSFSCKVDHSDVTKPPRDNEQELITTVKIILTNVSNSSDVRTVIFSDTDGPGGMAPVVGSLSLPAGAVYSGEVILLDETKVPADSISNGVYEERNEHQFFYEVNSADLTITYQPGDVDDNGVPLGILPLFTTGSASTGTFTVMLKHQPGVKPTSGNGDITKGDTDVEVTFVVSVL